MTGVGEGSEAALDALLHAAAAAAEAAYAPYSKFRVGASVHANGAIYTGCNIENASYGLTMCAERVAIFKAVAAGARRIEAAALACIDAPPGSPDHEKMPCGACRQVLAEFASPDMPMAIAGVAILHLSDLLPHPFFLPRLAQAEDMVG